ncbi:MAG TPA: DUF1109 domain-containing protein [Rhizomicrobium sp.]|jgi:hypothetical protein
MSDSTDKLIAALSTDRDVGMKPEWIFLLAVLAGTGLAALLFIVTLGPRPDFMSAMHTWRFVGKFVVTLALAASTALLVAQAAHPGAARGPADILLILAPALLLVAIVVELLAMPHASWMPRMMGHNALPCMASIPLFSLAPLALTLFALRRGAVTQPMRAGALAGLMAGGLGAALYAAHCTDDSPLFVALWYTLGIAFVTGAGALIGRRLLRW